MYLLPNFHKKNISALITAFLLVLPFQTYAAENSDLNQPKYQLPPKEIVALAEAPLTPGTSLSPDKQWLLIMERPSMPSIAEISQPELKLAGLRINPKVNGPSRGPGYSILKLKKISDGSEIKISGLPEAAKINYIDWAPDSNHFAFTLTDNKGVWLWKANTGSATAQKFLNLKLNNMLIKPFYWLTGKEMLANTVPENRGLEPSRPEVPEGPIIQENLGKKAPSRTYQDLLASPYDEKLFDYYFTSQIVSVNNEGKIKKLAQPGIFLNLEPSPDSKYLLVESMHRPYSYLVPYYRFPLLSEILDHNGKLVKKLADIPLAEEVPTSFDAVVAGPRNFTWRADAPATIFWVEAQDKGDPAIDAKIRDIAFTLPAPFNMAQKPLISLSQRFSSVTWGNDNLAIIKEGWWKSRNEKTWVVKPGNPGNSPVILFDRSTEDRYGDPGLPLLGLSTYNTSVLLLSDDNSLYFSGEGASTEGNRPFLDKFNLATRKTERLWRSQSPDYEYVTKILDEKNIKILTRKESVTQQPNFYIRDINNKSIKQLTFFPHPSPLLSRVKKQLIQYQREDGVKLNATLYLPPDYAVKDGTLPLLMWAYPREFKSADAASQITDSPFRFIRPGWNSPLFWLTQGYAILDGPTMPIIGQGKSEPNDTYVKQLVDSAKAAVDEVVRLGVADRERIAVGGHSYGAFMTANLLAHSDLFKAGIARSGAYNRTLTPFGFQAEERTLWQAPEIYSKISPFNNADKINEPILMIHGAADENPGTFPLQSERLYNAIRGLGGKARLVMLPYEGHGYQARESVLHMLWEMNQWLETYVKPKKK